MTRWVIDTSVLIDHLRGDARARDLLLAGVRSGHELWGCAVVRTEVLAGMRPREEAATFKLLAQLRWQDVTIDIADRAGELARRYLRTHPGVDTIDFTIAAAALVLGAELKTQNVKHFPMFAGLAPAYR
ncbi:MAG: type II toxin-antitoxin system VapC family toxin [Polyangiaceae bacterium]|nr:type II toxin-antitoxin system VapC family toxin [Polyangiaceae bacterium]